MEASYFKPFLKRKYESLIPTQHKSEKHNVVGSSFEDLKTRISLPKRKTVYFNREGAISETGISFQIG